MQESIGLDPATQLDSLAKKASLIDQKAALDIAQRFLIRLRLDQKTLDLLPPEVKQMELRNAETGQLTKLPFFAVRYRLKSGFGSPDVSLEPGVIDSCIIQ
jgi:hypothetical protein